MTGHSLGREAATTRALVVEDDPTLNELSCEMCEALGHDVVGVATVLDAEQALCQGRFDYVLLDLQIPIRQGRMARTEHGFGLLSRLGDLPPPSRPIILVMTAHGSDHGFCRRAFNAGCDDFVKKPFNEGEESPQWRIRRLLRKHQSAPPETERPDTEKEPTVLELIGDYAKRRCALRISGRLVRLSEQRFRLLGYLAAHAIHEPGEPLHLHDVPDVRARPGQAIYRLKLALEAESPGFTDQYLVQDGHGGWRLNLTRGQVSFDRAQMRHHPQLLRRLEGTIA